MNRRDLLGNSATLGLIGAIPLSLSFAVRGDAPGPAHAKSGPAAGKLTPPADGAIPVAFLISDGAVVIDFCGPWEVFENVMVDGSMQPFQLYTVSETTRPITTSGGMRVVPRYTIENAPAPKVIVIPAQGHPSEAVLDWVRKASKSADVTMSVCTGAYLLAATGMLAGKAATTHHASYVDLAMKYPDIHVKRGARFVEAGNLASAGGLSSGIDLALRVVERYYGRDVATQTAYDMEYQGLGWTDPDSNSAYAKITTSSNGHPLCVVCAMSVDKEHAPKSAYKGTTYYFCSSDHKKLFDKDPDQFVVLIDSSNTG